MSNNIKVFNNSLDQDNYINSNQYKEPYIGITNDGKNLQFNKNASRDPLTIKFLEDGYFYWNINWDLTILPNNDVSYSKNGEPYQRLTSDKIRMHANDTISLIGNMVSTILENGNDWTSCSIYCCKDANLENSAFIELFGNIMSLVKSKKFHALKELPERYYNNKPSKWGIFEYIFADLNVRDCSNLLLPATKLTPKCYKEMFSGCDELIKAPTLPALELVNDCYYGMFYDCPKLKYVKAMFLTEPSDLYLQNWITAINNDVVFVKNKNAEWSNDYIPKHWKIQKVVV